jgi:hypothetical protein
MLCQGGGDKQKRDDHADTLHQATKNGKYDRPVQPDFMIELLEDIYQGYQGRFLCVSKYKNLRNLFFSLTIAKATRFTHD